MQRHLLVRETDRQTDIYLYWEREEEKYKHRHMVREREIDTFCESFWCRYNKTRIDQTIVGCSNLVRIFNPTAVTEFKLLFLLLLFIKCAAVYREPKLKTERTFHYIHVILLFFWKCKLQWITMELCKIFSHYEDVGWLKHEFSLDKKNIVFFFN